MIKNEKNLNDLYSLMKVSNVDISITKFKFENKYNINNYLKLLGIIEAFNMNADFSGISG